MLETLSYAGAALSLLVAAACESWSRLREPARQHLVLGAVLAVACLWAMRAGIGPGLSLHLSAATLLALTLGWPLALLVLAGACLGLGLTGLVPWPVLGLDYLTSGVVPVAVSWWVLRLSERWLAPHLFVYLFVCAFFGSALAVVAGALCRAGMLLTLALPEAWRLGPDFLLLLPLIALPEALLNGFVMTGFVIMRPEWVRTYDDRRYLGSP
ncbi:MAG: energy-coupling factor ABC transporter permease [Candidatus Competibacterales bacterium]|nr:energy-coupling factor ABC transporter permease [Candidatus Competibacterales bacterium]